MSDTKHTPGPWTIFPHPDPDCPAICVGPYNGSYAECPITVYLNHEANAKLIAAAPDMLVALENLTNTVGKMPADNKKYPTLFGDLAEAREVIAKAKGKS